MPSWLSGRAGDFMRPWKREASVELVVWIESDEKHSTAYPCIIELCLKADVRSFFFVLRAEDIEFVRL